MILWRRGHFALMSLILMWSKLLCATEVNYSLFSECIPDDKADLTLKVGTALLSLNECPGFRDLPEASWHTQSQLPNRCQRAPRTWRKRTGKENLFQKRFKCERPDTKVYLEKWDHLSKSWSLAGQMMTIMAWAPTFLLLKVSHLFVGSDQPLLFSQWKLLITSLDLRRISGAERSHSGYKLRNKLYPNWARSSRFPVSDSSKGLWKRQMKKPQQNKFTSPHVPDM